MAWDDGLSDEQKKAASHVGKHARLLAGPGTGKTLSLTRRILFLVKEQRVEPSNILAVTFTRAAAGELRKRVKEELGEDNVLPQILTLHSYALRTILKNPSRIRLPQPIHIADDYEERWIIQEELKRILRLSTVKEVADLFEKLSANWEQLTRGWEHEGGFPNPQFLGAWREHRQIYGYTLRGELVYQLYQALAEGELEINPPMYFLVDEYQDLNPCDLAVIKLLTNRGAELFCAGDDDQSIYGFRYANPEGIRRFDQEFQPCESLELTECRRCDRKILDLALYVAEQDPRRIGKELQPSYIAGEGEVRLLRFRDQDAEAEAIAKLCKWLTEERGVPQEEILILLRSDHNNQFSKPIRETLSRQGLQVAKVADPFEPLNCPKDDQGNRQVEGRIFLCLLRLIADTSDRLAWRTILELRDNGIGDKTLEALYDLARKEGKTFIDVLNMVKSDPSLLPRFGRRMKEEVEAIEAIIVTERPDTTSSLMEFIGGLAANQINDNITREAVQKVFERVLENTEVTKLGELLQAMNVSLGKSEQERQGGAINLMTMHQAKGLSAEAVIVVAAEDEYIPGRALGEKENDERRLLYVSITRARHYLYLTHCQRRIGTQRHTGRESGIFMRRLTRFLSGGPIPSEDGVQYVQSLTTGN